METQTDLPTNPLTPLGEVGAEVMLARGTKVGRYVVVRALGHGGMGVVYAAYDAELDRQLALKLVRTRTDGSSAGSKGRERLLREAQAMAILRHPNVIRVHDVGIHAGHVFIAMEYVEGVSLRRWLADRRSWKEVLPVFIAAGRGLAAAHDSGLTHRDFKPDNVLIATDGRVKVVDFGLARANAGSDPLRLPPLARELVTAGPLGQSDMTDLGDLTLTGTMLGTPAYMAPEQHDSAEAHTVGPGSDQYSFCVSLWEALHGERPHAGRQADVLASQKRNGETRPPRRKLPRRVQAAMARGLSPRPQDRFPTLAALLEQLEDQRRPRSMSKIPLALGGGALVGVLIFVAVARMPEPVACPDPRSRLKEAWGPNTQARIESALLETEASYAEDTWKRVQIALDAWTTAWVEAENDACAAVRERGEQSERWLDERRLCLERRRTELGKLTEQLTRADATVVERAARAVRDLAPPDSCSLDEKLGASEPVPRDAALRARVDSQRESIQEAHALQSAGHLEEATALASRTVSRARTLAYDPLLGEALVAEANARIHLDHDLERQAARLDEAAQVALRGAHEAVATRAFIALLRNRVEQGQWESARRYAALASVLVDKLGDPRLEADLEGQLAWFAVREERFEEAETRCLRTLELIRRNRGPDHPEVAGALNTCGITVYMQHRKDEAVSYYEQALVITEKVHGPKHPAISHYLNNIGVVLTDRGRYEDALPRYERALEIRKRVYVADHPLVVQVRSNIANLQLMAENWDAAVEPAQTLVDDLMAGQAAPTLDMVPHWLRIGRAHAMGSTPAQAVAPLREALDLIITEPRATGCAYDVLDLLAAATERTGGSKAQVSELRRRRDRTGANATPYIRRCTEELGQLADAPG